MSVVSGKGSDRDESNSDFSTASSWSSALEISDFDVEFEKASSGSDEVKCTSRHSEKSMWPRSMSPGRPTGVSVSIATGAAAATSSVASRTSTAGRRGRTNVRNVSPIRAKVPLLSVRVQQRPTSPLKTWRVSPRRTNSGQHPLKPKFFIAVPPISSSLSGDTKTPSGKSNGANKIGPLRHKHRNPSQLKPPKVTLDKVAPALTPKITAKGPKTSSLSQNRTGSTPTKGINRKGVLLQSVNGKKKAKRKLSPQRRKSEDGALVQGPEKSAAPARRSLPLELLSSKQLPILETVRNSKEEEEPKSPMKWTPEDVATNVDLEAIISDDDTLVGTADSDDETQGLDSSQHSAAVLVPTQFAIAPSTPKRLSGRSRAPKRSSRGSKEKKANASPSPPRPPRIQQRFKSPRGRSLPPAKRRQSQPTARPSILPAHGASNPRRKKDRALGSITMSGLEVPVAVGSVDPSSVQPCEQGYKQRTSDKLPAEPKQPPTFCFMACRCIWKAVHQLLSRSN